MVFFENVIYDKPMCDGVINSITNWENAGYYVRKNEKEFNIVQRPNKRKSLRSDIIITSDSQIFLKLNQTFNTLNYQLICDNIEGSVIKYSKGDFLSKHTDLSDDFTSRMFCVIIQLSDDKDYEGGDFTYYLNDVEYTMNRNVGNVLIIKPEVLHEVKMVEGGERHSLIFWILSENIKATSNNLI